MSRQDYVWSDMTDCSGGINENPEEAQSNQFLDARNVWCKNGYLQQRPGYVGVSSYGGPFNSTGVTIQAYNTTTSTWLMPAAGVLTLNSLPANSYWYYCTSDLTNIAFAFNMATTNSNSVRFRTDYWNGTEWKPLNMPEVAENITRHLGSLLPPGVRFYYAPPKGWATTTLNGVGPLPSSF